MIALEAAPGIHRIEDANTNWYLVEAGDGLVVVDAGVPGSWDSLHEALRRLGRRAAEIEAIVLTHGHFDHIGFAERARRELGVEVWVHEDDVPLVRRPRRYGYEKSPLTEFATHPRALPILAGFLRRRALWPTPVAKVRRFTEADPLPGAPEVIATPGHTLGHVALHFADRDAVIVGDALVALDPYTARRGPRLVSPAATADSERALDSLGAIAATGAKTLLSGHGPPMDGAERSVAEARQNGESS